MEALRPRLEQRTDVDAEHAGQLHARAELGVEFEIPRPPPETPRVLHAVPQIVWIAAFTLLVLAVFVILAGR